MAHLRNTEQSYGIIAQAFHWLVALLVLAQIGIGVYAANQPVSLARLQWVSRHKSLGIAILALVLLRLAWRAMNPPPELPGSMAHWERRAALAAHRILYVLLVLVPLAGWLYASAAGLSVNWFGLFQMPDLAPKDAGLAELFRAIHQGMALLLALVAALHIGAALQHGFWRRDGVMHRMLPWKPRRQG